MTHQQLTKLNSSDRTATSSVPVCVRGTVQSLDLLGREIVILLPSGSEVFYVPPDCPIYLRGERIKLRVAQPRDEVRVTFAEEDGLLSVKLLELWPKSPLA